jgi:SAM-dependent methyltransferase
MDRMSQQRAAAPFTPRELYELATLYDRIVRPRPCEAFYRKPARDVGRGTRPVLELACGTGRLTIPSARDGHETVGLDTSPTMLEAARAKAESSGLGITFIRGDMRAFALHRHFGPIVVSCNSLAHLTTNEDLRACFRRVRDHLEPGGFFAFGDT